MRISADSGQVERRAQGGFTLVEVIFTMLVISVALAGLMLAVTGPVARSADPLLQIKAMELGQAMLDEILPRKFDENTPEGGLPRCGSSDINSVTCTLESGFGTDAGETNRDAYDDVDDFHGIDDSPPRDATGVERAGYANFRVQVTVSYAGADLGLTATEAKRILVTVTTPGKQAYTFSAYRANF